MTTHTNLMAHSSSRTVCLLPLISDLRAKCLALLHVNSCLNMNHFAYLLRELGEIGVGEQEVVQGAH